MAATNQVKEARTNFSEVTADNSTEAEVLLDKLKRTESELLVANQGVLDHAEFAAGDLSTEVEKQIEYNDKLAEAISRLQIQLRKLQTTQTVTQQQTHTDRHKIKIPKLELTKYDGNPLRWEEFWDDFSCSIDSRTDISSIDKFKLLKQSLQGEALSMAEGYLITQKNYQEVKDALLENFGDPQVAIFAHFEALLDIQAASHEVEQLIRIRDTCEAHIRSLTALGLTEETYGLVFAPIILSKLPRFVKMEMHRRNGKKLWTLKALRELLKEEIQARTKSDRAFGGNTGDSGSSSWGEGSKNGGKQSKKPPGTTTTLLNQGDRKKGKWQKGSGSSGGGSSGVKKPNNCLFCKGSHRNYECTQYPTVDSRMPQIQGRCFVCLSDQHMKRDCQSQKTCYYCKKPGHNSSLCYQQFGSDKGSQSQKPPPSAGSSKEHSGIVQTLNPDAPEFVPESKALAVQAGHFGRTRNGIAILESAAVQIRGRKGKGKARIVLDNGSTLSFVRTAVSNKVGAKVIGEDKTMLGRFGDTSRADKKFTIVQIGLELSDGSELLMSLRRVENVSAPLHLVPVSLDCVSPIMKPHEFAEIVTESSDVDIDILIGLDYYYDIVGPEVWRCSNGIVIKQTSIGKIVTGYLKEKSAGEENVDQQMIIVSSNDQNKDLLNLERLWRIEDIGVIDRTDRSDDEVAVEKFNQTVQCVNGRYEVQWPFKADLPELPLNYEVAIRRLSSVHKKLVKTPGLLSSYSDIFQYQSENGIIEIAPEVPDGPVHYLPHHAVVMPSRETTKVRVVFDASSKPNSSFQSLNESMYRGPVFLNDLVGLLLRFRLCKFAVTCDVEKAFLQIGLQKVHRDCTRFLWLKDPLKPPSTENLLVFRYARVLFGATASPFLLAATIIHHMKQCNTSVSRDIMRNTYMDNVIGGYNSLADLIGYQKEAKHLFESMSMHVHQWYSNSSEFMELCGEDRGTKERPSVLGIKWEFASDNITCPVGNNQLSKVTKRAILGSIASVCAGVFLRVVENTSIQTHLMFAKCRVAPVKSLSIPKLELTAASVGSKIISFVENHLNVRITRKVLWTDSLCALSWIESERVKVVYVENRVREIKKVKNLELRYVPTECNPADLGSRGVSFQKLWSSKVWWSGPEFLSKTENHWPARPQTTPNFPPEPVQLQLIVIGNQIHPESVFDLSRFSSLQKLLRVTVYVKRAIRRFKKHPVPEGLPTGEEMQHARQFWESRVQHQHFGPILQDTRHPQWRNFSSQLGLYVDPSGLIRCKGRFQESAQLSADSKHPILLPKESAYSTLVIQDCHAKVLHFGVKHTLAKLHERYWIPQGRQALKKELKKCQVCRIQRGGPFKLPQPPPLPDFRFSISQPFQCTGLDYIGPLFVREGTETKKVWIALFTCAVVRAIHLEVVSSMSAYDFLLCLRRFCALYSKPSMIVSDNAQQFKLTAQQLQRAFQRLAEDETVAEFLSSQEMTWKFIVEKAPWMGGFYERLVALVKEALKKTLGKWTVTHEELQTVCYEAAFVINSRPLTYVEDDSGDKVLTPLDLMFKSTSAFIDGSGELIFKERMTKAEEWMMHWRAGQNILKEIWDCWKSHYLLALRELTKR